MPGGREDAGRDLAPMRAAIVAAGRRLRAAGLVVATEGNLSVKVGDDALLITPGGRRKDELATDDLVVVGLRGDAPPVAQGRSPLRLSSDVAIHRAVHAARPDVGAVVHAHLPASMALTVAGELPDASTLPEAALFLGRLPFVEFGAPGSDELAARIATAMSSGSTPLPAAVLLERHGAVAVGVGAGVHAIEEAVDRLELVEVLCRTWRDALLVRAAATGAAAAAILRPPSPDPGKRGAREDQP